MEETIAANAPLSQKAPCVFNALSWRSFWVGATSALAQLRGHGGPVRALAISADGQSAISGSFDSTAIRWSLTRNAAEQVLRFHADAVNAVACSRMAARRPPAPTGGLRSGPRARQSPMRCWKDIPRRSRPSQPRPTERRWPRRRGIRPCGCGRSRAARRACSTGIRKTSTAWRSRRMAARWSASATIRAFASGRSPGPQADRRSDAGPLNAVAIGGDGEIAAGGADGRVYFLTADGARAGEVAAGPQPVISIAVSPDGPRVAAAGIGGTVAVIDRKTRGLARTLVGPGLPVWSVAFLPDSRTLLTGGADNIIRRWNAATGEPVDPLLLEKAGDPLAAYAGDHGAEIFRACVACHTLGADQANRAGPTLAGIFGRRIATAAGLQFLRRAQAPRYRLDAGDGVKAVRGRAAAYTPGTKMPEQRIGSEQDRAALVQILQRATKR